VRLARATTFFAWHDGIEHYLTTFKYQETNTNSAANVGWLVPLPAIPLKIEEGGAWTLQRLALETHPVRFAAFGAEDTSVPSATAVVLQQVRVEALNITVIKSWRLNRTQANQLRGQINRLAREQAFAVGTVTVEVNPHGTSQYCSRCGAKGQRFSLRAGQRVTARGGKLFWCPVCHYQAQADFNASANIHRSFYREFHWHPPPKRSG
jgi:hypothetical protein